MPKQVDIPGVGVVEFPDEMSDSQITTAIQKDILKESPAEGFFKETGRVLDKSFRGGLLGLPGAMGDLFRYGAERAVTKPQSRLESAAEKVTPQLGLINAMLRAYGAANPGKPSEALYKLTGGELSEPTTEAGKATGNVGASVVGAMAAPGQLPLKAAAAIGLGGGVGSEAAARLVDDNPLVRILGSLLGGGAVTAAQHYMPNAERIIKTATKGMKEGDWQNAKLIDAMLEKYNLPNLKSQLLGPTSSLDDVVAQASANPHARPTVLTATQDVVPKARQAVQVWEHGNLPVSPDEQRGMLLDIQKAAKSADRSAVKRANLAYEDAMPPNDTYPEGYIAGLKKDIYALATSPKFGQATAAGKQLIKWADDHLTTLPGEGMQKYELNNLIKDLNKQIKGDTTWANLPEMDLKALLKSYTPEFDAARLAKRTVMAADVTPMRQGLAGAIAQMGGGPNDNKYTVTQNVMRLVFPTDKAQPEAIRRLGKDIGGDQVGLLLREHLTTSFEKASRAAIAQQHHTPDKFVAEVLGSPAQQENLRAALEVAAKSQGLQPTTVQKGFNDLMEALGTYRDMKISPSVNGASLDFESGKSAAGALLALQSRLARWTWDIASAKTYQKIADLVTNPDGLSKLQAIATAPDVKTRSALVQQIIINATVAGDKPPGITEQ